MAIHPTAVVSAGAEIDPSAEIGPFCVVGPRVKIGAGTQLLSHVVVDNDTHLGERNVVHSFAVVGGRPQDLKFKGEPARLLVGNDNVIREGVTLNIGTAGGHMETRIGSGNLLMAYSHVAHDCVVGDHTVIGQSVGLAGHVDIGDRVILGGISGVHQFCNIGRHAFLAGGAMAAQNVPPFCIAQGDRAELVGINVVGLKRAGWSREKINVVREAFRRLFRSDSTRLYALERTEAELAPEHAEVAEMCRFIRASKRGVCAAHAAGAPDDESLT